MNSDKASRIVWVLKLELHSSREKHFPLFTYFHLEPFHPLWKSGRITSQIRPHIGLYQNGPKGATHLVYFSQREATERERAALPCHRMSKIMTWVSPRTPTSEIPLFITCQTEFQIFFTLPQGKDCWGGCDVNVITIRQSFPFLLLLWDESDSFYGCGRSQSHHIMKYTCPCQHLAGMWWWESRAVDQQPLGTLSRNPTLPFKLAWNLWVL